MRTDMVTWKTQCTVCSAKSIANITLSCLIISDVASHMTHAFSQVLDSMMLKRAIEGGCGKGAFFEIVKMCSAFFVIIPKTITFLSLLQLAVRRFDHKFIMISLLSLLINGTEHARSSPTFHSEPDGSVTANHSIMFSYDDVENQPRRRLLSEAEEPPAWPSNEFRQKMLDLHNNLRSVTASGKAPCLCGNLCGKGPEGKGYHPGATNMNKLFWDPSLEKVAQNFAEKCIFNHDPEKKQEALALQALASWTQPNELYGSQGKNPLSIGENLAISG